MCASLQNRPIFCLFFHEQPLARDSRFVFASSRLKTQKIAPVLQANVCLLRHKCPVKLQIVRQAELVKKDKTGRIDTAAVQTELLRQVVTICNFTKQTEFGR